MYEPKRTPLLPRKRFAKRMALHIGAGLGLLFLSLAMGMEGYRRYEHLAWRDAFLNAAMLMGGMGPVDAPRTDDGKLFAGAYALYAGLVFLVAAGLGFAPIVHRVMHKFHFEDK
jgi:hypothetical protein